MITASVPSQAVRRPELPRPEALFLFPKIPAESATPCGFCLAVHPRHPFLSKPAVKQYLHVCWISSRRVSATYDRLNDDPNTLAENAFWESVKVRRKKPLGRENVLAVISDAEFPVGRTAAKWLDVQQGAWQNELLEVFCKTEPLLDRDHYRILIGDDGRKYLRPIGYFYYADELEEGDGKPFRGVSFRTCDIPLDEFIDNVKNVEGYAADYQCEIRQYIDDLSAVGLAEAVRASGILSLSILPYDAITMDTPVGDYIA